MPRPQNPSHLWPHPPPRGHFTRTSDLPDPAPARPAPAETPPQGARTPPSPHRGAPRAGGSPSASSGLVGRSPARPFPQLRAPGLALPAALQAASFRRSRRTSCTALCSQASPPPPAPRDMAEAVRPAAADDAGSYRAGAQQLPRLPPSLPRLRTGSGILIIHEARPASPDRSLGLAHPMRRAGAAFRAAIG